MPIYLYQNDIPDDLELQGDLAVDCETRGLNIYQRDKLCVVQISNGDDNAHLVQFQDYDYNKAVNLKKLLADESNVKLFHFARFDVAAIKIFLGVDIQNIYCTKIASKIARTYTDRHSLKDLCDELLDVQLSKQQQCSDWLADLTPQQQQYAANDVLHLHDLRDELNEMLERDNRMHLIQDCFSFLPKRVNLDIMGWENVDIFAHS